MTKHPWYEAGYGDARSMFINTLLFVTLSPCHRRSPILPSLLIALAPCLSFWPFNPNLQWFSSRPRMILELDSSGEDFQRLTASGSVRESFHRQKVEFPQNVSVRRVIGVHCDNSHRLLPGTMKEPHATSVPSARKSFLSLTIGVCSLVRGLLGQRQVQRLAFVRGLGNYELTTGRFRSFDPEFGADPLCF